MSRANVRDTALRRALETICTELAVVATSRELASLRIGQAEERSGLTSLLGPALSEMDEIGQAVTVMHQQCATALGLLKE